MGQQSHHRLFWAHLPTTAPYLLAGGDSNRLPDAVADRGSASSGRERHPPTSRAGVSEVASTATFGRRTAN